MIPLHKVQACLCLNTLLLSSVISCIVTLASPTSQYFRFGPHEDFVLVSVAINTWERYTLMICLIAIMNCIKVVVSEIGEPVLVFNVYNPDKDVITDFSRQQLLFYANGMFFVSNVRRVFETMITVTQFDIAIFSIVLEQLVSIVVVCFLVDEKRFDAIKCKTLTTESEMSHKNDYGSL